MDVIIESLEVKINKLISLYKAAKKDQKRLIDENISFQKQLQDQVENINKLEEKVKILKISKVASLSDEDNKNTKQEINEYVREIDKCIALLNK